MASPIMYSYPLARAFTDPHSPRAFIAGLHAWAICRERKIDKKRDGGIDEWGLCYLKECPARGHEGQDASENVGDG